MTKKGFAFPKKNNMPFYYLSASDGTNVVKVMQLIIFKGIFHEFFFFSWENLIISLNRPCRVLNVGGTIHAALILGG